jgi:hypothetical protein
MTTPLDLRFARVAQPAGASAATNSPAKAPATVTDGVPEKLGAGGAGRGRYKTMEVKRE